MEELREAVRRSSEWLLARQDPETGGWSDLQGKQPSTLNTAEVLIALLGAGGDVVNAGDKRIQRAVDFLLRHRVRAGAEQGAWPREKLDEAGNRMTFPDIVRTSFAVQALIRTGKSVDSDPVRDAIHWIRSIRTDDGGWGYRRGAGAELTPTCFALMALLEAYRAGLEAAREVSEGGLDFLVRTSHNEDGSFGVGGRLTAAHTIYAILVLQLARQVGIGSYLRQEKQAIDWLLEHPDDAKKLVEENFPISDMKRGDYGFLYMTDALLLKVLSASGSDDHRQTSLATEALNCLKDKMHPDGGFYGYRVFSWSTAKSMSALSAAHYDYPQFPKRKPEQRSGRFNVESAVFLFAVLGAGVLIYLSNRDRFGLLQAALLGFFMLALLLAYGKLRERSFVTLVKSLIDRLRPNRSGDQG